MSKHGKLNEKLPFNRKKPPRPATTVSFIKKERFKSSLKGREVVFLLNPNWDLIP